MKFIGSVTADENLDKAGPPLDDCLNKTCWITTNTQKPCAYCCNPPFMSIRRFDSSTGAQTQTSHAPQAFLESLSTLLVDCHARKEESESRYAIHINHLLLIQWRRTKDRFRGISVSREEAFRVLSKEQAEELVFSAYRRLGLDEAEDFPVKSVKIEFEKAEAHEKPVSNPSLSADGTLTIKIRNTDLVSGVKHYLTTLVRDMETPLEFSYIEMFGLPFLYPLAVMIVFLPFLSLLRAFGSPVALLLVPLIYSLLVLPVLYHVEKRQRKRSGQQAHRVKSHLDALSLFTKEEAAKDSVQLTRRSAAEVLYNFTMYLVAVVTLPILALAV